MSALGGAGGMSRPEVTILSDLCRIMQLMDT